MTRPKGRTRISAKNQATLPVSVLRTAKMKSGDEIRVAAEGDGRIVLYRDVGLVERHAGALSGTYGPDYLDEVRNEWS